MAIDSSSKRSKPLNGVHSPRNRIGGKAAVQPLDLKDIILDAFSPYRQDICGLFLYGSYARGEESDESDIDVLAVCDKKLPEKLGRISILSDSIEGIKKKIGSDPVGFYSMVNEAVPILNAPMLEELKRVEPDKENLSVFFDWTRRALELSKEYLDSGFGDRPLVVYLLVRGVRGLFILKCLRRGEAYTARGLQEYVCGKGIAPASFADLLSVYRADKEGIITDKEIPLEALRRLYEIDLEVFRELNRDQQVNLL